MTNEFLYIQVPACVQVQPLVINKGDLTENHEGNSLCECSLFPRVEESGTRGLRIKN